MPGQAARDLSTLGSLVLTSVAAQPNGSGGPSSSLRLSGQVANPGTYNAAQLAALTPQTTVDVGDGTTYTGPPLASFLDATGNITSAIVDAVGTDGYTVALALAEVDPAVGGDANDILAWAINGEPLKTNAVARLIFPSDNQRGRWNSNLDLVKVTETGVGRNSGSGPRPSRPAPPSPPSSARLRETGAQRRRTTHRPGPASWPGRRQRSQAVIGTASRRSSLTQKIGDF